jgi:hypothetical protein
MLTLVSQATRISFAIGLGVLSYKAIATEPSVDDYFEPGYMVFRSK